MVAVFDCFRYNLVRTVAGIDSFKDDVALTSLCCLFPVRFRTKGRCSYCFGTISYQCHSLTCCRNDFVPKVAVLFPFLERFRNNVVRYAASRWISCEKSLFRSTSGTSTMFYPPDSRLISYCSQSYGTRSYHKLVSQRQLVHNRTGSG